MNKGFNNLSELLEDSQRQYGDKKAIAYVDSISYTYNEFHALSEQVAANLYGAGIEKGDKIALIGENSPHWTISYFGIQRAAAVAVPVLIDFSGNEMGIIMEHAGVNVIIASRKQLEKFREKIPSTVKYLMFLEDLQLVPIANLERALSDKKDYLQLEAKKTNKKVDFPAVQKDDLAVIIYTSGTTGRSKGVMLSQDNLISNAIQTGSVHQVVSSDVFLSVLPLAHTYEGTIGMLIPVLNGATINYIDRAPTASYLGPVLKKIKPTTMLTVPLIIEKIYRKKIKPGIQGSPVTRILSKIPFTRKIIHRAAGKKLMEFFGGRIIFFGVGGAPLAPEVEKFLLEAKFPYAIGYGLTETSPMLAGFGPKCQVYKSVGKVMEGVEIKINNPDPLTGEGEIVAKGRNIMKGYYQGEDMTKEVFTEDGYFRTGDLGFINEKNTLFIRGRSKNMILGANGENIYPEEIESVINEHEFVDDSLVMQIKGKLVAKIYLNLESLEEKLHHLKHTAQDTQQELHEKAEEIVEEIMLLVNEKLNKNSRLQLAILQKEPFEKTPTMKIKRFLYGD